MKFKFVLLALVFVSCAGVMMEKQAFGRPLRLENHQVLIAHLYDRCLQNIGPTPMLCTINLNLMEADEASLWRWIRRAQLRGLTSLAVRLDEHGQRYDDYSSFVEATHGQNHCEIFFNGDEDPSFIISTGLNSFEDLTIAHRNADFLVALDELAWKISPVIVVEKEGG